MGAGTQFYIVHSMSGALQMLLNVVSPSTPLQLQPM